ncbi:MAG: OmpA family protein [Bacteroidota bacterium]
MTGAVVGGAVGLGVSQVADVSRELRIVLTAIGAGVSLYLFARACRSANEQRAELLADFEAVQAERDSLQAAQGLAPTPPPSVEIVQVEQPIVDAQGNEAVSSSLMTKIEFGSDILAFESASAALPPQAELYLAPLAETLVTQQGAQLLIVGHTDTVGDENANLMLSEERAASVADFLSRQGVLSTRIQVIGSGEYDPAVEDERTEEDRARNRRVEVFVVHHVATGNA